MRPWQFGKPKTPGFGISSTYYLSVLSSRATMPTIAQIVEPNGADGAVVGFGAPLAADADKELLRRPLERGAYAVASKNRKTVLKMLVLSKEEAQFDPEAFAKSDLALSAPAEMLARIRATWTLAQLTFESHDPMVYEALDFLLNVSRRLAELADGVVADPTCRRYLLPEDVLREPRLDPKVDAREHISMNLRSRPDGNHIYTLGMQKFGLAELEIVGLDEGEEGRASRFLYAICQNTLLGDLIRSGDRYGAPSMPFEAREGGFDSTLWGGTAVLELLPPTAVTSSEALVAWEIEMIRLGGSAQS